MVICYLFVHKSFSSFRHILTTPLGEVGLWEFASLRQANLGHANPKRAKARLICANQLDYVDRTQREPHVHLLRRIGRYREGMTSLVE